MSISMSIEYAIKLNTIPNLIVIVILILIVLLDKHFYFKT